MSEHSFEAFDSRTGIKTFEYAKFGNWAENKVNSLIYFIPNKKTSERERESEIEREKVLFCGTFGLK